MRLAPKKVLLYLFINYNVVTFKVYIPCDCTNLSSSAAIVCSILGMQFVGCHLRSALKNSGCLLLTQNGVLSLLILLFEIKRSFKV
jgi:hypothetical protein